MSHSIQRQIQAIARRARRLLVVHGLCWFVAVVVAVAFVFGWLDYSLRLQDQGVRIIFSAALGLTLLWSFRHFVSPSLQHRFSDLEVAQRIERCFPQLGDRLSSSLDFLSGGDVANRAESASLQRTVIAETEVIVRPLNLAECLDLRATRRSLLVCIPLLIVVGVICTLDLDASSLAARRLAAPWSVESWPRWNSLELVNPPRRIALGQDFEVEVADRRRRLPSNASLQLWFDGDDQSEVEIVTMRQGDDRFHYTRDNVTRSFQYRAVGGDDDSMEWHQLEVVEPVRITDFRVASEPPAYSGVAPSNWHTGPIRVLAGTKLTIAGETTRPVQSVRVHINMGDATEVFDNEFTAQDSTFEITLRTETPGKGQYWIEVAEADGVISGSDTRASWEIVPDQAPTVTVSAPTTDMYFTPNATVPIRVTATDDLAIQHLQLKIGTTMIPLFVGTDQPAARDDLPAHADVREITRDLDLREFQLAPNDTLELAFVASDYQPQTSDPMTRSITIISDEDFDYRSQDKQKLLLARLVEALRLQRATRAQVASLRTQLETTGALSDDDASLLWASELQQQQVARLLDDGPGAASELVSDLIASLSSNQMASSDAAARMARLSKMLDVINRQRLPALQSEFVRATKSARTAGDDGDSIRVLLTTVGERQDAVAIDLQAMIDQLAQWDDYRRFAHDVANLLRDQQDLSSRVAQLPTIGQRLDTLSPQQQADLARASGEQLELARRVDRLQAEMARLEEEIRESDPAAAATISEAQREAVANAIAEQMRKIGNDVARNRLGNAAQTQGKVEQGLRQVLGALTESNRSDPSETQKPDQLQLAAALAQLKAQLADFTARQETLVEDTSQHLATSSSSLTPAEMAREQKQLAEDTLEAHQQPLLPKAFSFRMRSIETTMREATKRLENEPPDERVYRLQHRSLSRLQQLLAALSSDVPRDASSNDGNNTTSAPPSAPQPGLSLEELRLLYAMQIDLQERTSALEKRRQGKATLEDEEERELKQLAAEQGQLAELILEAVPAGGAIDQTEPPPTSREMDDDLDRALERAGIPGFGADE